MRQKLIFTIYCLFLLAGTQSVIAQSDSAAALKMDSFRIKRPTVKPTGDFDQRFSFIDGKSVSIWGYRIGLLVNDKFKTGIGGYFTKQEVDGVRHDIEGNPIHKLTRSLYYGTLYFEPYLMRRKVWETSLVFEAGYGSATLDSVNKRGGVFLAKTAKETFVPIGAGLSLNLIIPDIRGLHFLSYIGINSMIGIRKVIYQSEFRENFDGWYWSIGGAIFIDKIFTDISSGRIGGKRKPKTVD
jgi:hypothetical protein